MENRDIAYLIAKNLPRSHSSSIYIGYTAISFTKRSKSDQKALLIIIKTIFENRDLKKPAVNLAQAQQGDSFSATTWRKAVRFVLKEII